MQKVNDKIGNVRLFKKNLRRKGLIGNRQQFSEEHVQMFEEIREYKRTQHTTWEVAFKFGINSIPKPRKTATPLSTFISEQPQSRVEDLLIEILITLQRIEAKL
jgi:hypothetical protein